MLNIALPKGRLGDKVYDMLAVGTGYDCPGYYEQNRKLVFESPEKNVRYLLGKAQRCGDLCGASQLLM